MPILYQRRKKAEDAPRGIVKQRVEQEYDTRTVQDAIQAALDIERPDLAQQVAEYVGADVCILCVQYQAVDSFDTPHGYLQLCADCAVEYQPL